MRWLFGLLLLVGCQPAPLPCARDSQAQTVRAPLTVRLLLTPDVSPTECDAVAGALHAWATCAEVDLHVETQTDRALPPPFPLTIEALRRLPPDDATRAQQKPLADLLRAVAAPPGQVVVAVWPELVPPSSAAASVLPELVGLGLTATRETAGPDDPWLQVLPSLRTPVVLLSARQLKVLNRAERASAVGHELGHALGLLHEARRCNLMAETKTCAVGWLDAAQVATLRAHLP